MPEETSGKTSGETSGKLVERCSKRRGGTGPLEKKCEQEKEDERGRDIHIVFNFFNPLLFKLISI